jgi:hypothetical protein
MHTEEWIKYTKTRRIGIPKSFIILQVWDIFHQTEQLMSMQRKFGK